MATVDHRAIVSDNTEIANDVYISPYVIIGDDVAIDKGTWIGPHVIIKGPTKIGKHNKIFQFSSIGEDPQDLKYQGGRTTLEIGDHNIIREYCTLNRGTELGGGITKIGHHNLCMAYVHIAHDCVLRNHIILANNVSLAGHVMMDNYAFLGGFVGIHQFCRIGQYSFISAGSIVIKDVLPFIKVSGYYAKPFGLNIVGLQRHKFSEASISYLKDAYRIIYRQDLTVDEAIIRLKQLTKTCHRINLMIEAIKVSQRGIAR